jgi:hypothetical protein
MQITVTIPDELAAQAQARGLVLDSYLPELLAEDLAAVPATSETEDKMAARRNAAVDAMLGFAEKYGITTGGQDLKSMVHEGHKY